jgi:hypothetical protein
VVCLKFIDKLEFTESLPITVIEKVDDVLIVHCSNGFLISMNEESLCLWRDKESCYFFREDGDWSPMISVDMTRSTGETHAIIAWGANGNLSRSPSPPQQDDTSNV